MRKILVIDDSLSVRESLRMIFKDNFNVVTSSFNDKTFSLPNTEDIELVIMEVIHPLDYRIDLLEKLIKYNQNVAILLMVECRTSKDVVDFFDLKNSDHIFKPFSIYEIRNKVYNLLNQTKSLPSLSEVTHKNRNIIKYKKIYDSPLLEQRVLTIITKALDNNLPVLIKGEMGSGHEWVAKIIHYNGLRSEGRFIKLNCFNLTEESFINTLLVIKKDISFKNHGTLYLEELEKADLNIQMRLMEIIEEQGIATKDKKEYELNPRVIASTSKDLLEKIHNGEFREDLFYRLNTIPIRLSPLRERKEEIPFISAHILNDLSQRMKLQEKKLSLSALDTLKNYYWPGNVMELESVITRSVILTGKEVISHEELSFEIDDNIIASSSEDKKSDAWIHTLHKQEHDEKINNFYFENLITNLAHEMKNPLVSIKTFAQLLPDRYEDSEFRDRFYQIVTENVDKINNLVEEITEYTRFSTPDFCEINLRTIIGEILGKYSHKLGEHKSAILKEFDKGLPLVLSDKAQLFYVFDILFSNILSNIPEGRGFSISTGVSEFDQEEATHLLSLSEKIGNKALEIIIPLSHSVITTLPMSNTTRVLDLELFLAQSLINKHLGIMGVTNINEEDVEIRIKLPVALSEKSLNGESSLVRGFG
ncbi:MAG: sigma 54-interacting transcriptional regulator [Pseudomonadota bacterium]